MNSLSVNHETTYFFVFQQQRRTQAPEVCNAGTILGAKRFTWATWEKKVMRISKAVNWMSATGRTETDIESFNEIDTTN